MINISGEKAIKAVNLIDSKHVDISILKRCSNVVSYNTQTYGVRLSTEEFTFLKEIFGGAHQS